MTLDRRIALRGILGVATTCCIPKIVSAREHSATKGCLIDPRSLRNEKDRGGTWTEIRENVITSTGERELDRALGRALVRITKLFGVRPGFGFFDGESSLNAFASPKKVVSGTWGTVLFGRRLFWDLLRRYDDNGMAVLAIAAHELGHIAQFKSGVDKQLERNQPTVKRVELHADYLAGYFLGIRKRRDPTISVRQAGQELYRIGDYEFNNPDHHGTPDERVSAAEAGFRIGHETDTKFKQAFVRGIKHVRKQDR